MRPFGCPVTILNTLVPLCKFDGKADEGFLVGYSINSKAFRVFNTRTRKVEENLHITFLKNKHNVIGSGPDWLFDIDLLTNSMNYEPITAWNQTNGNAEDAAADDAGKKTNEKPANKGERNGQEKEGGASNKEGYVSSTNKVSTVSPSVSAVRQNFDNVDDLPTDPLMPDLEDTTNLLNTSIFSGAYDDEDEGAKAELNNLETTINVSPIPTTRIHKDHPKDRMDVKSTFLYDTIEEEVYVCQPPGFEDLQFPDKVYKDKGDILLVQVYVDDIIFGSTKKPLCVEFEQMIHKRFQMSSIGELTFFLGLQVKQKDDGIFISQDKYVADILKKFDFATVKTTTTPMETNKVLLKDEEAADVDVDLYRSMIGSLMYLTASRSDIMFAVCACVRFQVTPKVSHLHSVKMIFRYLKVNMLELALIGNPQQEVVNFLAKGVVDPKSNA
ncbi:uncharacterized mitochondrial protein-like protein [Tanacetum coccineum]